MTNEHYSAEVVGNATATIKWDIVSPPERYFCSQTSFRPQVWISHYLIWMNISLHRHTRVSNNGLWLSTLKVSVNFENFISIYLKGIISSSATVLARHSTLSLNRVISCLSHLIKVCLFFKLSNIHASVFLKMGTSCRKLAIVSNDKLA